MSLAVVTCFFNFANFKRPQSNLHRFLRQMKRDGVSVFGLEMSFDGNFLTIGEPHWRQVVLDPTRQSLWQKEAALNLVAKTLPPEVTAVAWVDADVWFTDPNWESQTLNALEEYDIVQMFETCHWTEEDGRIIESLPSCGKSGLPAAGKAHSGFAWAMRRNLWDKVGGLYPYVMSGGADSIMAAAFQRVGNWPRVWCHVGQDKIPFLRWMDLFDDVSVGYTPGELVHEWHGSAKNRDYIGRAERLADFHVSEHLEFDKRGLLRWTEGAPDTIVKIAAEYFPSRREDGT